MSREIDLEDKLVDVLNGLRMWRDRKLAAAIDWDDADEALIRWIEAGPAKGDL